MTDKKTYPGSTVIRFLEKIEDLLLIGLLLAMILLAVFQILLRNLFDEGILWADPLVRVLVLWIGLIGAMIASRSNHHISIDIISRYLSDRAKPFLTLLISIFTAVVCGLMTYYSYSFVKMEYQDGMTVFAKLPAWVCEVVIPFAFAVITLRYLVLAISTIKQIASGKPS